MSKRIVTHEQTAGGYFVTVEVPGAYTDGSSRFDDVFIAADRVRGKAPEQVRLALREAMADPFVGVDPDLAAPIADTKVLAEDRCENAYATWQRWKETHAEAVARGLAAALVTALLTKTNAAWAAYVIAIQEWRAAP